MAKKKIHIQCLLGCKKLMKKNEKKEVFFCYLGCIGGLNGNVNDVWWIQVILEEVM